MPAAPLAWLGLAVLLVGGLLQFLLPGTRLFAWAILALGGGLLAAAAGLDFHRIRNAAATRRGLFGVGASVSVALFSGIIVLANAVSLGAYHRFDVTGLGQFTLTSQTKAVLTQLDKPVEAVAFFTPGVLSPLGGYARNLLGEYRNHTDRLSVRDIDPDLSPDQARHYGIDRTAATLGAVVFTGEAGRRLIYGPQILGEAEHAFTAAILEVTGRQQRKVYFLTGHGEASAGADYGNARDGLRDNLFQVAELDLLAAGGVPADAAALIVPGPRQALGSGERDVLSAYLRNGGRVLLLLDPQPPPGFREVLADWGLDLGEGHVVDPSSHVAPRPDNPLVPRNRNSFGLNETYFPGATAIIPRGDKLPENAQLAALVWTSPESWLERTPASGEAPRFDDGIDLKGPLAVGSLVSAANGTRLIVIGDSDFSGNKHFHNGGNGALFLNAVNWLAEGKDILAIDRRVLSLRRLLLSPEQARFLLVSSMGLLPLILLIAGGWAWWRRR